jgi:hypothetical protein
MGFFLYFLLYFPKPPRAETLDAAKEEAHRQDLLHRASDGKFRKSMSPVDARSRGF